MKSQSKGITQRVLTRPVRGLLTVLIPTAVDLPGVSVLNIFRECCLDANIFT